MSDMPTVITALDIHRWADTVRARALLPLLVRRLIHETTTALTSADFPGYDEAQRAGWDGWTETSEASAWVPKGASGWELSVSDDNPKKPNHDWTSRMALPCDERAATNFVFVTARRWPGKQKWAQLRRSEGAWADVRTLDAEDLAQWIEQSPGTRIWFAGELGRAVEGLRTLDLAWRDWASACRPTLSKKLFDDAVAASATALATWRQQAPHRAFVVTADSIGEAVAFLACAIDAQECEASVVVECKQALPGLLATSPTRLIIKADPAAEAAAASSTRQHRLVFARTHATVPIDPDVVLEPMSRESFEAALIDMQVAEGERDRLTTEAGRSPTILRRRLALSPELRVPEWARDPALQRKLIPILLVGAWRAGDKADQACVVELAAKNIEEVERDVAELAAMPDAPVWAAAGYRGTVSRKDALFAIHGSLTEQDLTRFFGIAELVLTLDDPRLDLPEDKRWAAGIYGVEVEVSSALREAVGEFLVLLAIEGDRLFGPRLGPVATRVDHMVATVLKGATPRQWLSQHHLRWLAEASPDAFLDAVEADLRQDAPALLALMRPVQSSFGRYERTELLWALELLAWDPRRFPRVFAILARLSEVRIDDNWVNKPESSLHSLVRSWLPQTAASVNERIAVMRRFAETRSPVAWRLLISQFPRFGHAILNVRPRWREVPGKSEARPAAKDVRSFMLAALDLLLEWPDYTVDELGEVLALIDQFPDEAVAKLLGRADDWAVHASDADRAALRENLRRNLHIRRRKKDEVRPWAERLQDLVRLLEPSDVVQRSRWLFAEHWVDESRDDVDDEERWEKHAERIEASRIAALKDVLSQRGLDGVIALILGGNAAWVIGHLMARIDESRGQYWIDALLRREGLGAKADAAISGLIRSLDNRSTVLAALLGNVTLTEGDKLRMLLIAPFGGATWKLVSDLGTQFADRYWREVAADAFDLDAGETAFMIDRLLSASRPFAAFQAIGMILDKVEPAQLVRVIRGMRVSQGDDIENAHLDGWRVGRALARLTREQLLPVSELASIEFAFYPLLEHGQHGTPNLARTLAENPSDFMHLIKLVYKRDDGQIDREEGQEAAARTAWRVLRECSRLPGAADDGTIDADGLIAWTEIVRTLASEAARSGISDHVIGTVLSSAPTGSDGHWPHEAVRQALEHMATEEAAQGFITGKQNARGVVTRGPGGDQERVLAAEFRQAAEAMRLTAPFTARSLERLAEAYEHEARGWDGEDQVDRRLGRR